MKSMEKSQKGCCSVSWKKQQRKLLRISFACLSYFLMCQADHFLLTLSKGGRNLQIRPRNGENTKHDFEEIRPARFLPPHSLHPFSPNICQSAEKGDFATHQWTNFPRGLFLIISLIRLLSGGRLSQRPQMVSAQKKGQTVLLRNSEWIHTLLAKLYILMGNIVCEEKLSQKSCMWGNIRCYWLKLE